MPETNTHDVDVLTFHLPEPPSINQMIEYAKKRTRRGRHGGWMKKSKPIVYDNERYKYQLECLSAARSQGIKVPREPWEYWSIEVAHFRLWNPRDVTELAAGLKWACDFLHKQGFVADDSPRELYTPESWPTQEIDRDNRGLTLEIRRQEDPPELNATP